MLIAHRVGLEVLCPHLAEHVGMLGRDFPGVGQLLSSELVWALTGQGRVSRAPVTLIKSAAEMYKQLASSMMLCKMLLYKLLSRGSRASRCTSSTMHRNQKWCVVKLDASCMGATACAVQAL